MKHRADSLISANHYDPGSVRQVSEEVTKRWQQLVTCAEERHKLVTASLNFYKTAEQVWRISLFPANFYILLEMMVNVGLLVRATGLFSAGQFGT